jgi:spermidine synthase
MLGHLSGLLHSKPRSVLIVGFGAGVTAGSFVTYPDIERIVICEIEPLIPRNISRYFTKENYDVLNDPRVEVIYDDARHYLLTTSEKFDIITSDPIHPWVKGAASLYTREYYDTVKRHLNPGGVVTQWVPLYMSTLDVAKSEFATFFKVFPDGIIWGNETADGGYDLVMFGQAEPKPIEVDTLRERLASSSYRRVKSSLRDVEFNSVTDLLATYGGRAVDLGDWLADAFITTDLNLRLQYVAGMAYQTGSEIDIYSDLLRYREFPDALFVGSEETKRAIQTAMLQGPRVQDQGRQRIRATSRSRRRSSLATD